MVYFGPPATLEKSEEPDQIGVYVGFRVFQGIPDTRLGGQMNHALRSAGLEAGLHSLRILKTHSVIGKSLIGKQLGQPGSLEFGVVVVVQVIHPNDLVTALEQGAGEQLADDRVGVGQRIGIMAGSGVGKSVLMDMIVGGAEADAIVVGLIGERAREVSDFVARHMSGPAGPRTAIVAVPADHAANLRLRGAMLATSIAEELRAQGKRVLLILDSLTRVAHAAREIGILLGEPGAARGYPPSALSTITKLIERAGNSEESGGAITVIYTVLADGDDQRQCQQRGQRAGQARDAESESGQDHGG